MRRFVTLAVMLLFALPFGVSLSGCHKGVSVEYCNGQNSGVQVGQLTTLTLQPRLTGISLNQGQISSVGAPAGSDCTGANANAANVTWGTTNPSLVDIVPNSGRICAGTWNRQTGGGVADYTFCTPSATSGTAFVTAESGGVSSNALPVYVHAVVTSIVLGPTSNQCDPTKPNYDPASVCYNTALVNGACQTAPNLPLNPATGLPAVAYTGNSCLSQGTAAVLVARSFDANGNNISCQVGPIAFSSLNNAVVGIDSNGLATATQPGSTIINASNSLSSSSAGFFSTCPPKSIVLTSAGATAIPTGPISVGQNTAQTLTATVLDTNNKPINNLQLEYTSTTPTTIPANGSVVTPTFPGAAAITAACQPPACNASPFNQIGLFGNGTAVTSNPVQISAIGTSNSTILYIGSTNSQYVQPVDFTLTTQSSPARLPYVPNSMVITQDLSTIYLGSSTELMVLSLSASSTLTLTRQDTSVVGPVLSVSPDSSTVVITDPIRNLVYLYSSTGAVQSEYGGTGVRAQWSADSQTVYIATTDGRMLVHSTFTGWQAVPLAAAANDLAVTVPAAGVYLAGTPVTGRTNCPTTTINNAGTAPFPNFNTTTSNVFYPQVDVTAANASRVAATNDGQHILGASTTALTDVTTNTKSGGCPIAFTSSTGAPKLFTGATATAITGVLPTSDSTYALVTYTGTGAVVPQYAPGTGLLTNVALQTVAGGAAPTAPVAGVISSDNQTAFIGTAGDNLVHRLTRGITGFTDTVAPVVPGLPGFTGGIATPNLLVQRPRKSNS